MRKLSALPFAAAMLALGHAAAQEPDDAAGIHQVVQGYYDAFAHDSPAAAQFFGEPTYVVLAKEVITLTNRADIGGYISRVLAGLKAGGYSTTKLSEPRIKMLNRTTALYGAIAIRMKTDDTELQRVGATYLLHKDPAGWKIHELIVTDVDKLISAD
jgi:NTF2-like protein (DUF6841)